MERSVKYHKKKITNERYLIKLFQRQFNYCDVTTLEWFTCMDFIIPEVLEIPLERGRESYYFFSRVTY